MSADNRFLAHLSATATPEERLAQLKVMLLGALEDGSLTVTELRELRAARAALGLSVEQVRALRGEVYHAALQRAERDHQFSSRELDLLNQILQFFNDTWEGQA